jgi:hypothetical protein
MGQVSSGVFLMLSESARGRESGAHGRFPCPHEIRTTLHDVPQRAVKRSAARPDSPYVSPQATNDEQRALTERSFAACVAGRNEIS